MAVATEEVHGRANSAPRRALLIACAVGWMVLFGAAYVVAGGSKSKSSSTSRATLAPGTPVSSPSAPRPAHRRAAGPPVIHAPAALPAPPALGPVHSAVRTAAVSRAVSVARVAPRTTTSTVATTHPTRRPTSGGAGTTGSGSKGKPATGTTTSTTPSSGGSGGGSPGTGTVTGGG